MYLGQYTANAIARLNRCYISRLGSGQANESKCGPTFSIYVHRQKEKAHRSTCWTRREREKKEKCGVIDRSCQPLPRGRRTRDCIRLGATELCPRRRDLTTISPLSIGAAPSPFVVVGTMMLFLIVLATTEKVQTSTTFFFLSLHYRGTDSSQVFFFLTFQNRSSVCDRIRGVSEGEKRTSTSSDPARQGWRDISSAVTAHPRKYSYIDARRIEDGFGECDANYAAALLCPTWCISRFVVA